jgi:predicted DCC family thiol-disulfide oxidoreductase YuxK
MAIGRLLPRPVRDWLYGIVARNRLRWFGRRETCYLPDPAEADRFLA